MPLKLKPAGQEWARHTAKKAMEMGHPAPEAVVSLVNEISNFNPGARGQNGTVGIGRFTPEDAQKIGLDPTDPYASIEAVIALDLHNMETLQDRDLATAAFFMGAEQVAEAVQSGGQIPEEVIAQVQKVNSNVPEVQQLITPAPPTEADLPIELQPGTPPEPGSFLDIMESEEGIDRMGLPDLYEQMIEGAVSPEEFVQQYARRKFSANGVKI